MTTESTSEADNQPLPTELLPLGQSEPPGEGETYAFRFPGAHRWRTGYDDILDAIRAALDALSDDAPHTSFETAIVRPATHADVPLDMLVIIGDIKTQLQEAAMKSDARSTYLDDLTGDQMKALSDTMRRSLHEALDDLEVAQPPHCATVRAIKMHDVAPFVPSSVESLKMLAKGGLYSDSPQSRLRLQCDLERVFGLRHYERATAVFERAMMTGRNKVDKIIAAYEEMRDLIAHHD